MMMKTLMVLVWLVGAGIGCSISTLQADETHDVFIPESSMALPHVRRHQFYSEVLGQNRTVDVALPVNYSETSEVHKYPVIIVMDGELIFPMVAGIINQMTANSQMPDSIVVGIQNEPNSRRSITPTPMNKKGVAYSFGGKEDDYLSFLTDEVLPLIETSYRAADFRTLIGLSPTAQFTLHAFWKAPEVFDGYVAINAANYSAVAYGGQDVFGKITESVANAPDRAAYLYISMPKGGVVRHPAIAVDYNKLGVELAPFERLRVKTEVIPKAAYAATLPAILSAFDMMFPPKDWDPNYRDFMDDQPGKTLTNIKAYFSELSSRYGFQVLPKGERFYNMNRLKYIGYAFLRQGRLAEATDIFSYWCELYPRSANAQDSLADALEARQQLKEALAARLMAVSIARSNKDTRLHIFESGLKDLRAKMVP